jgi:hypothetical protein
LTSLLLLAGKGNLTHPFSSQSPQRLAGDLSQILLEVNLKQALVSKGSHESPASRQGLIVVKPTKMSNTTSPFPLSFKGGAWEILAVFQRLVSLPACA